MKINRKEPVFIAVILLFLMSCQSHTRPKVENLAPNAHQVVAEEVIQTRNYTYIHVSSGDRDYWIATNKMEVQEGETYFWSVGSEMNNFTSNELNRTFESIFFVQDFTNQPITKSSQSNPVPVTGRPQTPERKGIEVPKAEDGITIAELYKNRSSWAGKTVKIRGEVVKFSSGIMGRNWVHLQDGTKEAGNYDLTVTTNAFVNTGEVVMFEGIVSLDKDFGAGYYYEVIVEDASVK